MADKFNRNRNRMVDDAGVRLAPSPIAKVDYHVMPTVMQEYVIEPTLVNKEETPDSDSKIITSTIDDAQPKREEITKKWKRGKRAKNIASGIIALIASVAVLMPYVLGVAGVNVNAPIVVTFDKYGAIAKLVYAFKQTAALGWSGDEVNAIWVSMVPSLILTIGILFVLINAIKSVFAIFGAVKPVRFVGCAMVNLLCVLAILVANLSGASVIGIEQIDFMQDFIHGYASSELFTLVVLGVAYALLCMIGAIINRDKCGYLK